MKNEYKVVIYPEEDVLVEMKKRIYDYCKQLKILEPTLNDPFLTIKENFHFDPTDLDKVKTVLDNIAKDTKRFDITISKIDSFPKREFFYKIDQSDSLRKLHINLINSLAKDCYIEPLEIEGKYFSLRIPLLFGDFRKDDYDKAALLLQDYHPDMQFEVNNICLIRKEGKFWKIEHSSKLTF